MSFNSKYNLEEGQLAQRRVLLLINYDLTKTYDENLTSEQSVSGLPTLGGLSMSGIFDPLFPNKVYNWFASFDTHDWLTFIEITTGILGMIPSPLTPVLLGISLAAGTADAMVYFSEGDDYMGGLMLAFAVIPGAEFIKAVPGLNKYFVKGTKYITDTLKTAKSLSGVRRALTAAEKLAVKEADEIIQFVGKNADEVARLMSKNVVLKTIKGVISIGGKLAWGTALLASKIAMGLAKPLILLGGIYYTYDEIYLALYADDETKKKLRYNSSFQELVRLLKRATNLQSAEEQRDEFLLQSTDYLAKNPTAIASIDAEKKEQAIKENEATAQMYFENIQKQSQKGPPSLQELRAGVINPYTRQPWVLSNGMGKNGVIFLVQRLLSLIGYKETLQGYDNKKKFADGWYGTNTTDAVLLFQSDYGLPETGEVDAQTFNKLLEVYNKKEYKKKKST